MTVKIGIIGTRTRDSYDDYWIIWSKLCELLVKLGIIWDEPDIYLVSGGCGQGGDRFAEQIARENGYRIIIHYAFWTKYGKSAGPIRNKMMVKECDYLIACVSSDRKGGTENAIEEFIKLGKEDKLIIV